MHKKSKLPDLDDFRPSSLLPCLSKVFEVLAKEQIVSNLDAYHLLSEPQSGFRSKHSTNTALLRISGEIRKSFDKELMIILILLDFTKALDMLRHDNLLRKLADRFHFSTSVISLITNYLTDRIQCVAIDDSISESIMNRLGIPQGSVLGILLFSLYINELPDNPRVCTLSIVCG